MFGSCFRTLAVIVFQIFACWIISAFPHSTVHRLLTSTGSLTRVCDLFACVYTHLSLWSRPWDSCRICTEFGSGELSGRAQSLARNSHTSVWRPRSIALSFGFWERVLLLCARLFLTVHTPSLPFRQPSSSEKGCRRQRLEFRISLLLLFFFFRLRAGPPWA